MGKIIGGKKEAEKIRGQIRDGINKISVKNSYRQPGLEVIIAGNDPASIYYAELIEKAGVKDGIKVNITHMKEPTTEGLISHISKVNKDRDKDGILLQMPLPDDIDDKKVFEHISPEKDIDGQTPLNQGRLFRSEEGIFPATALAVVRLLKINDIKIKGASATVVGASSTVGLPTAKLLLDGGATVTVCHDLSDPLRDFTSGKDLVVVAAGVPELIGPQDVKTGASVIDVGTNEVNGKIVGDVAFDSVLKKADVSPVVGGVGALTLAMLFKNTFEIYRKSFNSKSAE